MPQAGGSGDPQRDGEAGRSIRRIDALCVGRKVGIGRPRLVLALFGMGLTRLSMSPAFVPAIKELLRHTTQENARDIASRVLRMSTVGEVRGYLTRRIRQICPDVSLLDIRH